jgi:pimeloyl-ACP methyl ester carboxylesterase
VAPDLNIPSFERLDFRAMSRVALWDMKKHLPAVVVGSSLGALVALEAGRTAPAAPLVLIAPALGFGSRWLEKLPPGNPLPFFHHGEGKDLLIHRRFFEVMAGTDADRDPPETPVTILMGRLDESVPFDVVRGVWTRWEASGRLADGSRFVEIPAGDHGLTDSVNRIAEEILLAAVLPR